MKQLLCSAFLLLVFTSVHAKGFMVMPGGSYGGMIYSGNKFKDYGLNQKNGAFSHVGIQVGYMFTKNIGIFSGIGRNAYHWSFEDTDPAQPYSDKIRQTYLEIPVFARFATGKEGKIGFLAKVGLSLAFLQGIEEKINDNGRTATSTDKKGFQTTILNARYTVGVHIPIGKLIWIDAGPECRYSLHNNYEEKTNLKGNFIAISGYVGVGFRLTH